MTKWVTMYVKEKDNKMGRKSWTLDAWQIHGRRPR